MVLLFVNFLCNVIVQIVIILIELSRMSWTGGEQSQSPEALSDPLPRVYACFCEKRFTTYPGIYLHLKSKHFQLFQKYKKLKITRLFKKMRDQKGLEIYRLQRLSEKEGPGSLITKKKIKQHKKNHFHREKPKVENEEDQRQEEVQQARSLEFNERKIQELYHHSKQNAEPTRINSYPDPKTHFPFGPSPNQMVHQDNPVTSMYYPPPPHHQTQRPTIKQLMQKFFLNSPVQQKLFIRRSLQNLMMYIQVNYENLNDLRTRDRIFFSYCDQFDCYLIKPLIQGYIGLLNEQMFEIQGYGRMQKQKQIDCCLRFLVWLTQLGMIQFSIKLPSLIEQPAQMIPPPPPINLAPPMIPMNQERSLSFKEMILESIQLKREGIHEGML